MDERARMIRLLFGPEVLEKVVDDYPREAGSRMLSRRRRCSGGRVSG